MTAFYNEIDPYAADWLENLIAAGHIAPGVVDRRSITEISPDDLRGFTQVHFFAGIGGWSLALRLAGWPDDRPVWTGSCPCQPFSAAGKGEAFQDPRHLWPAMHGVISAHRPKDVFGEQVASAEVVGTQLEADFADAVRGGQFARANKLANKIVKARGFHFPPRWLDLVSTDLERDGYSVRSSDLPACSAGAPHIRQRIWWRAERLADGDDAGSQERWYGPDQLLRSEGRQAEKRLAGLCGMARGLADSDGRGRLGLEDGEGRFLDGQAPGRIEGDGRAEHDGAAGGVADADGRIAGHGQLQRGRQYRCQPQDGGVDRLDENADPAGTGPTNGFWRDADWLGCRDDRWRPVEPGTFPLAHGIPGRVGRLRAYGNAIVPQVAALFIRATEEASASAASGDDRLLQLDSAAGDFFS